jgi:hypothetical protein
LCKTQERNMKVQKNSIKNTFQPLFKRDGSGFITVIPASVRST